MRDARKKTLPDEMSSWTSRIIPRKRDVTSIPEPYRPVLTSRAEHPSVVLSETFQPKVPSDTQEYDARFDIFERSAPSRSAPTSIPTPTKVSAPRAIELRHPETNETYVFVILRNLRSNADNQLWISSYNAIRQYYTNKIIIIDDNSTVNTVNGKLVNTEVMYSEYSGAGEVLPYFYFLKNKWADRMIVLHDSMFMARPFRPEELGEEMRFLWHFMESSADRKMEMYLTMLPEGSDVWEGAQDTNSWRGCFGAASIVSLRAIEQLEARYEVFTRLVMAVRARVDRKMFERIIGLLASREGFVGADGWSTFGDIRKYPDAFESQAQTVAAAQRLAAGYDTAVWKVWKGR